jgi:hypothetical protein
VRKLHEALYPYAAEDRERTLASMPVLARLLVGQPLTEDLWASEKRAARTFTWIPAQPRSLHPGDQVRVKVDAYPAGKPQAAHNGKVGRVVALRGGVIVAYDGERSASMGVRHPWDKLDRQVPIKRQGK